MFREYIARNIGLYIPAGMVTTCETFVIPTAKQKLRVRGVGQVEPDSRDLQLKE